MRNDHATVLTWLRQRQQSLAHWGQSQWGGLRTQLARSGQYGHWLWVGGVLGLCLFPPLLVVQHIWLNKLSSVDWLYDYWCRPGALCLSKLPAHYVVFIFCSIALLGWLWLKRDDTTWLPGPSLPSTLPAAPISLWQVRVSWALWLIAAITLAWRLSQFIIGNYRPHWDGVLIIVSYLLGWFVRSVSLAAVWSMLQQQRATWLAMGAVHLALLMMLKAAYSTPGLWPLAAAMGFIALSLLWGQWRYIPAVFWAFSLALLVYSLYLNSWWFSVIGDEYSFFSFAKFVAEDQLQTSYVRIFDAAGVYGQEPFVGTLIQAGFMAVLGVDNFGWRMSSIYVSAAALIPFYFFLKAFTSSRLALLGAFWLAASSYLMAFGRVGYDNTQSLLALCSVLWAAARVVQSRAMGAFVLLGAALAFCFYTYPGALYVLPLPILLLLWYVPPVNASTRRGWLAMTFTLLFIIWPLLLQPAFWQTKQQGTLLFRPELLASSQLLFDHLLSNFVYALYAFLFVPAESHYVAASHVDPLTGALVLLGLARCLFHVRRDRFAQFALASLGMVLIWVGTSHSTDYPSNTRMFLLLPWWVLMALAGLHWLMERTRHWRPVRQPRWVNALLVIILALNVFQTYGLSFVRWSGVHEIWQLFLEVAERATRRDTSEPVTFAFITEPRWGIHGLLMMREVYPLVFGRLVFRQYTIYKPELSPTQWEQLAAQDTVVILSPVMEAAWQSALSEPLARLGKQSCAMRTPTGIERFSLWHSPSLAGLCAPNSQPALASVVAFIRSEQPENLNRTRAIMLGISVSLSLLLSWAFTCYWHLRRARSHPGLAGAEPGVRVLGQYSPVLTALQNMWQRRGSKNALTPQSEQKRLRSLETKAEAAVRPADPDEASPPSVSTPEHPPQPADTVTAGSTSFGEALDEQATRVNIAMRLPPGTRVRVTVETLTDGVVHVAGQDVAPASVVTVTPSISQSAQKWKWPLRWGLPHFSPLARPLPQIAQLNLLLAAGALLVYLLTRFIGLDQYPIYFLGDEAVHTVRAAQLVRAAGYHAGEYLPTYFANGSFLNLSVSVYAQVLPYLIFGSSVVVTRTVSVLLSLLAAAAVGLTLRDIFKVPYWWAATLLLGLMPVWFLHSRTAFESVEMASFYAAFLYAYLRYRTGSVRWLYGAAVFGALAFYTYSPGQMVMAVTGLLLLIADVRYHWQNRATVLRVALLLIVLALPYVRFQLNHSEAAYLQLRERGSYLLDPNVPAGDKITHTVLEYLYGLSPSYWYNPQNPRDLTRHLMPGYGNLPWWTLPLALIGFGLALWRSLGRERDPAYRVILLALLAAPTGGALAEIGNLRVLAFVIPATLLTALGLAQALQWLERRASRRQLSLAAFVILAGLNGWMLREALVNGPTWSTDYGLYGMQYGSRQVFGELVPRLLREHPTARVIVSPSWANGTDLFTEFFLSARERSRVEMQGADYFRSELRNVSDTFIVWPRDEYEAALNEPKFGGLAVQEIIPYPDGTPGFYVVQLAYAENANALFAAEEAERRKPVTETAVVDGQTVAVTHSRFDGGALADLFDGDAFTLARGMVDNPIRFDLQFPAARPFTALTLTTATMERFTVRVQAYPPTGEPWVTEQVYRNLPADPTFEVPLDGAPAQITRLVIEIFDELATDPAHVHVREIVIGK